MAFCFENVVALGLYLACKALQGFCFFVFKSTSFLHGRRRRSLCQIQGEFTPRACQTNHASPLTFRSIPSGYNPQGYDSQVRQGPQEHTPNNLFSSTRGGHFEKCNAHLSKRFHFYFEILTCFHLIP
jgi:hypothetical protein